MNDKVQEKKGLPGHMYICDRCGGAIEVESLDLMISHTTYDLDNPCEVHKTMIEPQGVTSDYVMFCKDCTNHVKYEWNEFVKRLLES